MKNWLRQHAYALAGAWRHIRTPRGGFILNVIVIAIALMLPFAGLTLLENIQPVSTQLMVEPEISIFLQPDTPRDKATALAGPLKQILQREQLNGKLEFIPREKALAMLDDKTGLASVVTTLGSNPLPDAYVLKIAGWQNAGAAARSHAILVQLQALPDVEQVQMDSAWVQRLAAIMDMLRLALLLLAVTLGTVVVAVVFNTIRLQVLHHSEEIAISKLVGAANGFIYRPFYYAGAFLGLVSGMLALTLVILALQPMNQAIAEVVRLYGSSFQLRPPGVLSMLLLLLVSAGLGLLGALFSVHRSIRRTG